MQRAEFLSQRNFSAILFLGDDFIGGEYFWTDDFEGAYAVPVTPECGRAVLFQSSELHGVRTLLKVPRRFACKFAQQSPGPPHRACAVDDAGSIARDQSGSPDEAP